MKSLGEIEIKKGSETARRIAKNKKSAKTMVAKNKGKMRYIATKRGLGIQSYQLIEEMAELTQALNKLNRVRGIGEKTNTTFEKAYENVIEEIADVENLLYQIKHILCIDKETIHKIIDKKTDRSIRRLEERTK